MIQPGPSCSSSTSIPSRIEAEFDLSVHRWDADNWMLVGKIYQVKNVLDIISEYGSNISSILQPTKMKAFLPAQDSNILVPPLSKS